ncbi:MAG: type II toxin-antitoxin system HicA family toxin [Gemmatimonadota bacterium]
MTDYSLLRSLTARQLAAALSQDGFTLARQKGSHRHYKHPDGRRVTLSFHRSSQTFGTGLLKKLIEVEARWSEDDLRRLKLLP